MRPLLTASNSSVLDICGSLFCFTLCDSTAFENGDLPPAPPPPPPPPPGDWPIDVAESRSVLLPKD